MVELRSRSDRSAATEIRQFFEISGLPALVDSDHSLPVTKYVILSRQDLPNRASVRQRLRRLQLEHDRDVRRTVNWKHMKRNVWMDVPIPVTRPQDQRPQCICKERCDDNCLNKIMQYECDKGTCPFGDADCGNRALQVWARDARNERERRDKANAATEIVYTGNRGFGLRARKAFKPGELILEYIGDVISGAEMQRRLQTVYRGTQNFYFLSLERGYVIDSGTRGSAARFVNHSCDPNSEMQKWFVEDIPRIGLYAAKHIEAGTEITYDYNFDWFSDSMAQQCQCGSVNCRGVIGKRTQPAPAPVSPISSPVVPSPIVSTGALRKSAAQPLTPHRRGPGRPSLQSKLASVAVPEKRGRGRPRKYPLTPASIAAKAVAKTRVAKVPRSAPRLAQTPTSRRRVTLSPVRTRQRVRSGQVALDKRLVSDVESSERVSEDTSVGASEDTSVGVSEDTSVGASEDTSVGVSEDISVGMSEDTSVGMSEDTSVDVIVDRNADMTDTLVTSRQAGPVGTVTIVPITLSTSLSDNTNSDPEESRFETESAHGTQSPNETADTEMDLSYDQDSFGALKSWPLETTGQPPIMLKFKLTNNTPPKKPRGRPPKRFKKKPRVPKYKMYERRQLGHYESFNKNIRRKGRPSKILTGTSVERVDLRAQGKPLCLRTRHVPQDRIQPFARMLRGPRLLHASVAHFAGRGHRPVAEEIKPLLGTARTRSDVELLNSSQRPHTRPRTQPAGPELDSTTPDMSPSAQGSTYMSWRHIVGIEGNAVPGQNQVEMQAQSEASSEEHTLADLAQVQPAQQEKHSDLAHQQPAQQEKHTQASADKRQSSVDSQPLSHEPSSGDSNSPPSLVADTSSVSSTPLSPEFDAMGTDPAGRKTMLKLY